MTEDDLEGISIIDLDDVVKYVDATSLLVESIVIDIKKGKEYSTNTIVALSKLQTIAAKMTPLLDAVEKDMLKLN